jgi:hypothetical protein
MIPMSLFPVKAIGIALVMQEYMPGMTIPNQVILVISIAN